MLREHTNSNLDKISDIMNEEFYSLNRLNNYTFQNINAWCRLRAHRATYIYLKELISTGKFSIY